MFKGILGGLILIFLSGCGIIQDQRHAGTIEAPFLPYVMYFASKAGESRVPIGDLYSLSVNAMHDEFFGGSTLAICSRGERSQQIYVKCSYWEHKATIADKEQLMFHELGHCLLGLNHDTTVVPVLDYGTGNLLGYNMPVSIMFPYHFDEEHYAENREEYIKQLFQVLATFNIYYGGPSQMTSGQYEN